jgi:hypothetical protein
MSIRLVGRSDAPLSVASVVRTLPVGFHVHKMALPTVVAWFATMRAFPDENWQSPPNLAFAWFPFIPSLYVVHPFVSGVANCAPLHVVAAVLFMGAS